MSAEVLCWGEGVCLKMREADKLNDELAEKKGEQVVHSPKHREALAFLMTRVLTGVCPACKRRTR